MGKVIGWEAEVRLHRGGKVTAADAVARGEQIALAYGVPPANVVAELSLDAKADRFRLLVLERNPLQQVQEFTGPTLDRATGRIRIGLHADDTPAEWQMWRPGWGACHGMIAGTTGSGKSALLQVLLAEARHSGLVVPWLGDPDNGSNDWKDHVDCYAGSLPRIRLMLRAAEAIMQDRSRRWTVQRDPSGERRDTSWATPSAEEPEVMVIIDEAPEVLVDEECARIIARIGKRGRKWLVSVQIVTLVPSLAEMGNNLSLRSMLSSMNVVMYRTSDKLSAQMGALSAIDPHGLPKQWPDGSTTAGLGYLGSGDRLAAFRGFFVADGRRWATTGTPARLGEADTAAAEYPSDYYATWRSLLDVPDDGEDDDDMTVGELWQRGYTAPARLVVPAATKRDAILAYLTGHGRATTGVIAQALAVPLPTVSQTMRRLADAGLVVQVRHGMWAVPDAELVGQLTA